MMKSNQQPADPVADLIDHLDQLTVTALNAEPYQTSNLTWFEIGKAFDAVINHPASRWSRKELSKRQKDLHFYHFKPLAHNYAPGTSCNQS